MAYNALCRHGKTGKKAAVIIVDGKPRAYCHGWIDKRTDETVEECKNCINHYKVGKEAK